MDPTVQINERVDVVAVYHKEAQFNQYCVPWKMRWRGQEIQFTELTLRHPTVAGKRMIHVFHVTDGHNGYRLEYDAERLIWTLIAAMPELPEIPRSPS